MNEQMSFLKVITPWQTWQIRTASVVERMSAHSRWLAIPWRSLLPDCVLFTNISFYKQAIECLTAFYRLTSHMKVWTLSWQSFIAALPWSLMWVKISKQCLIQFTFWHMLEVYQPLHKRQKAIEMLWLSSCSHLQTHIYRSVCVVKTKYFRS